MSAVRIMEWLNTTTDLATVDFDAFGLWTPPPDPAPEDSSATISEPEGSDDAMSKTMSLAPEGSEDTMSKTMSLAPEGSEDTMSKTMSLAPEGSEHVWSAAATATISSEASDATMTFPEFDDEGSDSEILVIRFYIDSSDDDMAQSDATMEAPVGTAAAKRPTLKRSRSEESAESARPPVKRWRATIVRDDDSEASMADSEADGVPAEGRKKISKAAMTQAQKSLHKRQKQLRRRRATMASLVKKRVKLDKKSAKLDKAVAKIAKKAANMRKKAAKKKQAELDMEQAKLNKAVTKIAKKTANMAKRAAQEKQAELEMQEAIEHFQAVLDRDAMEMDEELAALFNQMNMSS